MKQITDESPWRVGSFVRGDLPVAGESPEHDEQVSDSVKLRIITTPHSSLHVRDIVPKLAREIRRIVSGVSVRYRNRNAHLLVDDGIRETNCYSYELNLVGKLLGEISFRASSPYWNSEQMILKILLCSLVHPLRNALLYERALKMALKDPLTGVNNRASMRAHINQHISLAQRQNTPLSVLMIDIDLFKSVNDHYGHIVGDIVLTHVAKHIINCTRTSDGVFRYGGEEFVVMLPSTASKGAELLADRIRSDIESMAIESLAIHSNVTVRVGVAHYKLGESQISLLKRTDDMLLAAKRSGRNRVIASSTTPDLEPQSNA